MPLLEIRNASKAYSGVPVLRGVDLVLEAGRLTGLIGENGAGKSTLIRILTGLTPLDDGQLLVDGQPVSHWNATAARDSGISVIHQELQLVPELTIAQNMSLGRRGGSGIRSVLGIRDDARTDREAAGLLGEIGVALDVRSRVADISPTEAQLVLIARALRDDSRILIMDEPTAALAANERDHLFTLIRRLLDRGTAILLVSHHLHEVEELAHDVVALRNGMVSAQLEGSEITVPAMVRAMLNRDLNDQFPTIDHHPGADVALTATVQHPRLPEWVRFEARRGEILGIVGLLGAGKTEIARALVGLDGARGTVVVRDVTLSRPDVRGSLRAGMLLVPEERKQQAVFGDLGVYQNGVLSYVATGAAGARRIFPFGARVAAVLREVVAAVGVRFSAETQPASSLSGGNQQKLVLTRVLACSPTVLVLDEPTRGVDVGSRRDIYDIIAREAGRGLTVVVASSDVREVHGLAHRILVLQNGRIAHEIQDPSAVTEEDISILLNPTPHTRAS